MKILFVEDHALFADQVKGRLAKITEVTSVTHVRGRDEAIASLDGGFFDLLILDLAIFENEGSITPDLRFGQEVFRHVQQCCPGLPTYFLTTSDPDDDLMAIMRETDRYDIWGELRDVPALDYFQKERATERLFSAIEEMAATVRSLDAIAIDTRGRNLGLSEGYQRAIRVFTRQRGANVIEVRTLSGGQSRARVVHGLAKNDSDQVIASTVIKLGSCGAIEQESSAFDRHVGNLPNGMFTPKLSTVLKGTGGAAAVIYSLAETYNQNMFQLLLDSDEKAAAAVALIAETIKRWNDAGRIQEIRVGEIRHRLLWEDDFRRACEKFDLDLTPYEACVVRHRYSCIHADLHGGNILVDGANAPILIDFGEVGPGAAALDPIALGLSIYFHPDAVALGLRGKAEPALLHWLDPDAYIAHHPYPKFAKAYRDWAYNVAGGDRAVLACVYTYLVRQLKFDTVDHEMTVRLIHEIGAQLR